MFHTQLPSQNHTLHILLIISQQFIKSRLENICTDEKNQNYADLRPTQKEKENVEIKMFVRVRVHTRACVCVTASQHDIGAASKQTGTWNRKLHLR